MPNLSEKLRSAREGGGLTYTEAAKLMPSITAQGLRHLEDAGPRLNSELMRVGTVTDIIEAYWPLFCLTDFVDCSIEIIRP